MFAWSCSYRKVPDNIKYNSELNGKGKRKALLCFEPLNAVIYIFECILKSQ